MRPEDAAAALKRKLAGGEATFGAWLTVPSPTVAEAMASLGFDWLAVDMEHGTAGVDQAVAVFMASELCGVAPLARLPSADPYLARRLLDGGAAGLIVPVVESARAFGDFLRHTLYPAAGRRGVGLSRCNRWGDGFDRYRQGFSPVLVPQIETAAGVAEAPAIAALPEVDSLFLGPYDLSADLGFPGEFDRPEMAAAERTLLEACRAHGKAAGIHQVRPERADLAAKVASGFRFIAYATDMIAMRHALAGFRGSP